MTAAAGQSHRAHGQAVAAEPGGALTRRRRECGFGTATAFSVPSAVTPAVGSGHGDGLQTLFSTKRSDLLRLSLLKTQKNDHQTDNFNWIFQINLLSCSYAIRLIAKLIATLPTLVFDAA